MIIKEAIKPEDVERCRKFLKNNGDAPATNTFIYIEDESGNILAVTGLEIKFCIEPMCSSNALLSQRLFDYAVCRARDLGHFKLHAFTKNDKLKAILVNKFGGKEWSIQVDEILIQV